MLESSQSMPEKTKSAHGHGTSAQRDLPKNQCFACGPDNSEGMHLRFDIDEQNRLAICKFTLSERYQGPPGHAHGGIIATILDEAMGKVNKLSQIVALTKRMEIDYLKPVPLGQPLIAIGREKEKLGRKHTNVAEITNESGEVLARSEGLFIAVDAAAMFAKYVKGGS